MNTTTKHKTQYKNSPLGLIPEDWEVKKLGEIGEFKNGINKDKEDFGFGFPLVNLMDVFGVNKVFKNNLNLTLVNASERDIKDFSLSKGDVLFIRSSVKPTGVGLTTLICDDLENTTYSGFIIRFRDNEYLNLDFKAHCFYEEGFRQRLLNKSTISANTNINQVALKSLTIVIPTLPEQKAIADCLTTWDTAIEKQTALIAQKELAKKALMQQLLSGKKRLKGFEDQKGSHKTDFGYKIPKDWQIVTVSDLFVERHDKSNDQNEYPLFSLTIENGLTEKTERYERSFLLKDKENNQYKIVCPDDILFNPMNLRFGAIAKSEIDYKVLVSGYYNVISVKDNFVNVNYFIELFKTAEFSNFYDRIAIGSLMEKKRVHLSNFLKLQVPLPSFEEQTAIATVLQCADDELQLLKKKLDQLKEQKKGLMQVLLTGKKRLNF